MKTLTQELVEALREAGNCLFVPVSVEDTQRTINRIQAVLARAEREAQFERENIHGIVTEALIRAYAIELSTTQAYERELRVGYRGLLDRALAVIGPPK